MEDPVARTAASSDTGLAALGQLEQIGDIEEIRRLKHRCMRCIDLKQWDQLDAILTPDARFSGGTTAYGQTAEISGTAAFIAVLQARLGPAVLTEHILGHPEITVDGDTATGFWSLRERKLATAHRMITVSTGFCEERYERGSDRCWRITRIKYHRNYEIVMSLDDLPSFKLIAQPERGAADRPAVLAPRSDIWA